MCKKILRALYPMLVVFLWDFFVNFRLGWYDRWNNLDVPMHLLGGFVTAWCMHRLYGVVRVRLKLRIQPDWLLGVLLVGLTALIALGWEFYEFFFENFVRVRMQWGVGDTIGDQLNGMMGAVVYVFTRLIFSKK